MLEEGSLEYQKSPSKSYNLTLRQTPDPPAGYTEWFKGVDPEMVIYGISKAG